MSWFVINAAQWTHSMSHWKTSPNVITCPGNTDSCCGKQQLVKYQPGGDDDDDDAVSYVAVLHDGRSL